MSEPRRVSLLGFTVEVSNPYNEGHKCNAAEADVLNQTRSQNIGNNLREEVRKLAEIKEGESKASAAQIEQHSEAVQTLVSDYDLGKGSEPGYTLSSGGRRTSRNPLERIAWRMAGEAMQDWLRETGKKRGDFDDSAWNTERERLASEDPNIQKAAKAELADSEKRKPADIQLG